MKAIGLAGLPASGKTTLVKALAEREPKAVVRSFGGIVRAEARTLGQDPDSRHILQAVGMQLLERPANFVTRLLCTIEDTAALVVIDGIRHPAIVEELRRQLDPTPLLLVYVDTPPGIREERMRQRGEAPSVEDHPVELEIPQLQLLANLEVRGDDSLPLAVSGICAVMKRLPQFDHHAVSD